MKNQKRSLIKGAKYFIKDLKFNDVLDIQKLEVNDVELTCKTLQIDVLDIQILEVNDVELTYKSLETEEVFYRQIEEIEILSIINEEEAIRLNNQKVYSVKTDLIKAIIGRSELIKYSENDFKDLEKDENTVLITIYDPDLEEVSLDIQKKFKDCLSIGFWDVEKDTEVGKYKPIEKEKALLIKEFILKHKDDNFIINCEAGMSRSAGVGYAVLCLIKFNGDKYSFSIGENPIKNHHRYYANLTVFDTIVD